MSNKFRFFRVATEGAITNGRVIDRNTIIELAKSFNPKTYGARIWLEHILGMMGVIAYFYSPIYPSEFKIAIFGIG